MKLDNAQRIAMALRAALLMKDVAEAINVDDPVVLHMILASVSDKVREWKIEVSKVCPPRRCERCGAEAGKKHDGRCPLG